MFTLSIAEKVGLELTHPIAEMTGFQDRADTNFG